MCPLYPRLPLTVREVPPNEEPLDANREPLIELVIELLVELLLVEALDPK